MAVSKRGFLLGEQTLKIIIAILCILLLIFLLYSIYSAYMDQHRLEQAESSINLIVDGLAKAETSGSAGVVILNPASSAKVQFQGNYWWIIAWPYKEVTPASCLNKGWVNCVCICSSNFLGNAKGSAKECDRLGTCVEVDGKVITKEERVFDRIERFIDTWGRVPLSLDGPPINFQIKYDKEKNEFEIMRKK